MPSDVPSAGPARVACVDVPALPLQLLLRRHPTWRDLPTAVVKDDRPQGRVLWINRHGRDQGILPGMTFAAARSLAADLRAAVVAPGSLEDVVAELATALGNFSPRVEAAPPPCVPGVFFVDPSGMTTLYGSHEAWAQGIGQALRGLGFRSSVVVGSHRFRSHAIARSKGGTWVLDPGREARMAARVPLRDLDLSPDLRDALAVLDIHTLGRFLQLPATEMRARFGPEAAQLHAMAADRAFAPLQPRKLIDPVGRTLQFEPPDSDHTRVLFGLKGALHELLGILAGRGQAMSLLHLTLELDHAPNHPEALEPASPTLDELQILDLVRLRLEGLCLPAAIAGLTLELEGIRADARQLRLFETRARRDLDAGNRALARIRAAFGETAVSRASLRTAHLPEAGFCWEPTDRVRFPSASDRTSPSPSGDETWITSAVPLVRRLFSRPIPLPPVPRHEPESWLDREMGVGAVTGLTGPYRISGGWWVRTVERDYYYVDTRRGDLLWVFYDRRRRRWFWHGIVD